MREEPEGWEVSAGREERAASERSVIRGVWGERKVRNCHCEDIHCPAFRSRSSAV